MKLRTGTLGAAFALAAWMAPAGAAPVPCEYWNTLSFFIRADAADLARCLGRKAPDARDAAGLTPMHRAAGFGRTPALITVLAKAGAALNARDANGMTPLHMAVNFNGNPAVTAALIGAGAKTAARDRRGWTPLHLAAAFGKAPAVVRALVEGGAEPGARTGPGRTALHLAALKGSVATADALIELGAKVDARDARGRWTPLHLMMWFGKSPAVARALIEAGADAGAKDRFGRTPLYYTRRNETIKGGIAYFRPKG